MACFCPITGYRAPGGQVVFNSKLGYVDRPLTISCGQCAGCRLERSRQWAVRCLHESEMHEHNSFITLTYKDENLPPGASLHLPDWQKFAKNVRRTYGPFRYYHCGEYGDLYGRPHLHACLFGIDFHEDRTKWKLRRGNQTYQSKTLSKLWTHGSAEIGSLTFESAAYCARYIMKKITGEPAEEHYEGRKPEYTTMSRRPGIGKTWLDKYSTEVYKADSVIINAKPARPPKFYDGHYEINHPSEMEIIKSKRVKQAQKRADNNTPERLAVREKKQKLDYKRFQRDQGKTQ